MNVHSHISEDFLHFIWKNNLFDHISPPDTEKNKIQILDRGKHNFDAGPDFFNAKIKIDETVWAGNIEIHKKSSDWIEHAHHKNKAYDNVILQLVLEHDIDVYNTKGQKITTSLLNFDRKLIENYEVLQQSKKDIACLPKLNKLDHFTLNAWLTNLLIERFQYKTNYFKTLLKYTNNNWEEAFYIFTARYFGFNVNSVPFEMLAKSIPLLILAKNKNNRFTLEALLFGQAGMLNEHLNNDSYYNSLKKEYQFLKKKYELSPIENHLWKFLRIRPVNFPTIRISQFANLIFKSSHLFSKILEAKNLNTLRKLFDIEASEYWNEHYSFGKESKKRIKKFGKSATDTIIINTIIPIIFFYGKIKSIEDLQNRAFNLLEEIKPEKNSITNKWISGGIFMKNAYFSQSYIHLYNEYCLKKRCLNCRIGIKYMIN